MPSRFPVLRDYEVLGEVGRGTLGTVFKALHRRSREVRALKRIERPAEEQLRVKRDFRVLCRLQQPALARAYEVVEEDTLYLATELVEGRDLLASVEPPAARDLEKMKRLVYLMGQLLKALGPLHAESVVHHGLKPGNVLVGKDGKLRLIDAGLSRELRLADAATLPTDLEKVAGYLSPEQLLGKPYDARLDLYQVGLLLYEGIAGRRPHKGNDLLSQLQARLDAAIVPLDDVDPAVARAFGPVLARLLPRTPEHRYGSAGEAFAHLRDAWDQYQRGRKSEPAARDDEAETKPVRAVKSAPDARRAPGPEAMAETFRGALPPPATLPATPPAAASPAAKKKTGAKPEFAESTNSMNPVYRPAAAKPAGAAAAKPAGAPGGSAGGGEPAPLDAEYREDDLRGGVADETLALREAPRGVAAALKVSDRDLRHALEGAAADAVPTLTSGLVGRGPDLERLEACYRKASDGQGRLVSVSGEAGVGKSRLVAELAGRLQSQGAIVLTGRGDESRRSRRGILTALLDDIAHRLAALPPADRATLLPPEASALAEVSSGFRELVEPEELSGDLGFLAERQKFRVRLALAELLRRLVATSPVVLLLEDLHTADAETVGLVAHVVHALLRPPEGSGAPGVRGASSPPSEVPARFLAVASYRSEEVDPDHPLARALAELAALGLLERVVLERLAPADAARMAATMVGVDTLPEALARHLQRETDGNPLFIVETMSLLREESVLGVRHGKLRLDEKRLDRIAGDTGHGRNIPAGILETVKQRLVKLSAGALEALQIGAMAGSDFGFELLRHAGGDDKVSEDAWLDAVQELMQTRVLREDPARPGRYLFDHDKVREVVLSELSPRARRGVAARAARALEESLGDKRMERAADLASLFEEAKDPAKLAIYVPLAAEAQARDGDLSGALGRCERALAVFAEAAPDKPMPVAAAPIQRLRARLLVLLGQLDAARKAWEERLEAIRSTAPGGKKGPDEVDALNGLAEAAWKAGDFERAQSAAEEARKKSKLVAYPAGEAAALENLGVVERRRFDLKAAAQHFRDALKLRRNTGDEVGVARALSNLGILFRNQDNYEKASKHFEEAEGIYRKIRDRLGLAMSLSNRASVHSRSNEFEQAAALYREAQQLDEAMGNARGVALGSEGLGHVYLTQGDYAAAREQFEKALETFRRIGDRPNAAYSLINLGHTDYRSGRLHDASQLYEEAIRLLDVIGNPVILSEARSGLALALDGLGAKTRSVAEARAAVDIAQKLGAREKEAWARHTLARVEGSLEEAGKALTLAESVGNENLMFMVHHQLACLHMDRSEREPAREHLQKAFTLIDQIAERTGKAKETFLKKPPVEAVFKDAQRL